MTLTRVVTAVLLAVGLTACGQGPVPAPPPVPATSSASALATTALADTARAFAELVIATGDQALKLLTQGGDRASSPSLRSLAQEIAAARRGERAELHGLLLEAGVAYVNNHEGHDMPGMPTDPELAALAASPDFDAEFTRLLRAHLTESATVAESGAAHQATKDVAERMREQRRTELARLDQLAGR
ncbi:uncharacterized protein (DUF305 family) [Crossiella equi]|uniref:Uncharacterized protein (DUF305 family) n=1 Tax=Crossiella equi TaxID=130796 RepID=A0ABS5A7E2_9PSEU|nr:DUF305 domain-containing protein [Crossiella equi]MBP2472149.1 uncharacterized protein (DUF305 family) [Crossiella equi]